MNGNNRSKSRREGGPSARLARTAPRGRRAAAAALTFTAHLSPARAAQPLAASAVPLVGQGQIFAAPAAAASFRATFPFDVLISCVSRVQVLKSEAASVRLLVNCERTNDLMGLGFLSSRCVCLFMALN